MATWKLEGGWLIQRHHQELVVVIKYSESRLWSVGPMDANLMIIGL